MGFAELGRVALEVDDIDEFAADLNKALGIELEVHGRAEESLGLRAATGAGGVELVQRVIPNPEPAKYWKGLLAAIILAVDDLREGFERMRSADSSPYRA